MLFIFSTPELMRHLWQLKTSVFLHWCLICAVPLQLIVPYSNIFIMTQPAMGLNSKGWHLALLPSILLEWMWLVTINALVYTTAVKV
jgi:hypothetical protein